MKKKFYLVFTSERTVHICSCVLHIVGEYQTPTIGRIFSEVPHIKFVSQSFVSLSLHL